MNVKGKVAIVTGAARSVGRATASLLAEAGCAVMVHYNSSKAEALKTVEEIQKAGGKAASFSGAIEQDGVCRALVDATVKEFGRLDVLVNNAGTTKFIPHADLEAVKDEDWDRIFAVNVRGLFQCARAARPHLEANEGGAIVNVASVAGITGAGSSIPYCASKAAVINLTISLARTLGPKIRVNAVAPGFIEGEWLKKGLGTEYEAAKRLKSNQAVLGKVSQPEDIARAILSFITGSDMVTGQVMVCDGGHALGGRLTQGIGK